MKFQPFIEVKKILLVTDHSALQWARTYESTNCRLAAWGAVYSAYAPGLEIVHQPGRLHSNVDSLSRLPRAPPDHTSPQDESGPTLELSAAGNNLIPSSGDSEPARRATFIVFTLDDCLEGYTSAWAITRAQKQAAEQEEHPLEPAQGDKSEIPKVQEKLAQESFLLWEADNPPANMHIHLEAEVLECFVAGYQKDEAFKRK